MKTNTLLTLSTLCLAIAGTTLATTAAAAEHRHEHGTAAATLQLNAGQKWATDAPLREAMRSIRTAMATALHDIHEKRLSKAGYGTLAKKIEAEVGNIVRNCKLDAGADEQLHVIIGDMLAGTEKMAGEKQAAGRERGAVAVVGALEKYSAFFDDAGFVPIKH